MKKLIMAATIVLSLTLFSGAAYAAANPVSRMAVQNGGQHIAECAQRMERGISMLATGNCTHME